MKLREPVVEYLDPMMVEILRRKTHAERLSVSFRMWETAKCIIGSAIRAKHPTWTEAMVSQEIAKRISHGVIDAAISKPFE